MVLLLLRTLIVQEIFLQKMKLIWWSVHLDISKTYVQAVLARRMNLGYIKPRQFLT